MHCTPQWRGLNGWREAMAEGRQIWFRSRAKQKMIALFDVFFAKLCGIEQ